MNDYGRGGVLSAATTLPATSATAFFMVQGMHPAIVIGFMAISLVSLVFFIGFISRFLINRTK